MFIQQIVQDKDSAKNLKEILEWTTAFLEFGNQNIVIDVQKLYFQLEDEQKARVWYELDRYVEYPFFSIYISVLHRKFQERRNIHEKADSWL
jgi:hypothetical protein